MGTTMKTLSTALLLTGLVASVGLAGCQTVEYDDGYDAGYVRRPAARVVYQEDVYVSRPAPRYGYGYDRPRRWSSDSDWGSRPSRPYYAPAPQRPVYAPPPPPQRPVYAPQPQRPAYVPPPVAQPGPQGVPPPIVHQPQYGPRGDKIQPWIPQ